MEVRCKKDYDEARFKISKIEKVLDLYKTKSYPRAIMIPLERQINEIEKAINSWKSEGGKGGNI